MSRRLSNETQKTVILVWSVKVCNIDYDPRNHSSYWGLGDLIRGACAVLSVCEKLGIRCIVDVHHHPACAYLTPVSHEYEDEVRKYLPRLRWEEFYAGGLDALHTFVDKVSNYANPLIFSTNSTLDIYESQLTPFTKHYMQRLLTPRSNVVQHFMARMAGDYGADATEHARPHVFHIRLKDSNEDSHSCHMCRLDATPTQEANAGTCKSPTKITSIVSSMSNCNRCQICLLAATHGRKGDRLLSNSGAFKKWFATQHNGSVIAMTSTLPVHTGVCTHTTDVADTMYEFWIMCNAQSIKTYSDYGWTSGFANAAHYIFDVPVVDLKKNHVSVDVLRKSITDVTDFFIPGSSMAHCVEGIVQNFSWMFYAAYYDDVSADVERVFSILDQDDEKGMDTHTLLEKLSWINFCNVGIRQKRFISHASFEAYMIAKHMHLRPRRQSQAEHSKFDHLFYLDYYYYLRKHGIDTYEKALHHYEKHGRSENLCANVNELLKRHRQSTE